MSSCPDRVQAAGMPSTMTDRTVMPTRSTWPLGSWSSARERSRQPERWEHAVLDAGHGADPIANDGEQVEKYVADAVVGSAGGPERWLTVRLHRDEVTPQLRCSSGGFLEGR